ncbi:MAG: 6-carboxytetrahydropterin synthase [Bacteroidetes bacterium]|nr:6-carboxytetrahydropterin synthase [Bacteroidota bacterium]
MTIAKRFRWEGAHRLPWHEGGCQHLHGHSYRMTVELDGPPDERGLLIDFKDLKALLRPLIDAWDHATLVAEDDVALREALERLDSKYAVLPVDTTSENLCTYVADYLARTGADVLREHGITAIRVRIQETETCYAEAERRLPTGPAAAPAVAAPAETGDVA